MVNDEANFKSSTNKYSINLEGPPITDKNKTPTNFQKYYYV